MSDTPQTTPREGGRAAIGDAVPRVDGPKKVTGRAPYTADHRLDEAPLIGWIVPSRAGRARVDAVDTARALDVPGVVAVLTHRNAPKQAPRGTPSDAGRFSQSHALLAAPEVACYGEPVALVLAETLEAAREAAGLVEVALTPLPGRYAVTGDEPDEALEVPDDVDGGMPADMSHGDFDLAWEKAEVRVDATYETLAEHASAMEPHATLATWDGEELVVRVAIQIVGSAVEALANTLRLDKEKVRVISPFIGGGFGSKLGIHDDAVLASLGAIATDRPVRVVQTRRDLFSSAPHRGCSTQRVRLGASRDGRLLAVAHESVMPMARGYEFAEPCAASARASYACDGILTRHRVVRADLPRIDSMRGPGEAVGSLAFESAVDELARALERDPVAFRLANVAETEPISGKPFASFDLRRCLEVGAERYGWSRRAERGRRDGRWLLGHGVASATRPNFLMEAKARVRLEDDGRAVAELDMTDIGTGSYTILSQIVADTLELPLDRVEVRLGDSRYPQTAGSGGSFGAASAGGALLSACRRLRGQLRAGGGREAEGHIEPGEDFEKYAQYMTGAHFVEVGVDEVTSEVRVRRAVGAFSFGRVLNPTTARSQLYGGMVFGIGGALTEGLHLDERVGAYMNRDLAGYHLPTERDVPALEVVMIGERDDRCGLLGSKGVGELGLCGLGAAIANAVYDACGARVRRFPLTPDAVMAARAAW